MHIEGNRVRLRALEPGDVELLYAWENDYTVWAVSGTTEPFSRKQMERFVEAQRHGADLLRSGQLRLIIEALEASGSFRPVGALDLFEYDPIHRRAGLGILIHATADRGCGYASDALQALERYVRERLNLHQLWCNVAADNAPSLHLFASGGYAEAGRKCDWLWTTEGFRDEILLQKLLE